MIVWRITGNEIGPNSCGAYYFATKREADNALRDYRAPIGGMENEEAICDSTFPERLVIKGRRALARELNDAMGYGAS